IRGGPDQESLAPESSVGARGRRRRACALPPADFFLMVMPWRAKNRESALRLPGIRRLRSVETISFSVRSDCSLMRARICRECFSNGEVLPPRSMASESPVFPKALHPSDRRTDADLKLFGRFPSRSSFFHEVDDTHSQLTRIRSMHWPALRRINASDSHLRRVLGIPIHCGRDVL